MSIPPQPVTAPDRQMRHYLLRWVMGILVAVWCCLVGVAYYTGWHEAEEITKGQLIAAAELLLRQPQVVAMPSGVLGPRSVKTSSYSPELYLVVWEGNRIVWDSHGLSASLPGQLKPGHQSFDTLENGKQHHWHLYVEQLGAWGGGGRRVAVFTDALRRKALERDIAEHIARPALVLFPLVAVLLFGAIERGLGPLRRLSGQIAELDVDAGQPLPAGQRFRELRAIADAINTLIERLKSQVQRERRFASDVAHELRTPLTSIVLQARAARQADTPETRQMALQRVEHDALHAGRVLTQLLELARAQGLNQAALVPVELCGLARQVLAGHAQQAHESAHELALAAPEQPVWVAGHETMLELALRNLVDNALNHTPAGTQVEVAIRRTAAGQVVLSVSDDGARAAAPRVAQPGMGIGLTLVQRIADWQRIGFDRGTGEPPFTTCFALTWPDTAAPAPSCPA
ncbi:MAG TPA: histidine kinase dimerization/phospho-acceptor domain-containing protein [Macromonas sp.]|nr:histidine kinase dimerization/phospho-acceptor domain-containing protein [Macromonas sp.]